MGIKRRDFFKQGALLASAVKSRRWLSRAVSVQEKDLYQNQDNSGEESWKNSVCRLCPGGCGIRIRLIDKQPVAITGNPLSPVNHGGICPTGHSGLQHLFSSDRIANPMKRVGEKGAGKWQTISWQEALQTVAQKLVALREQGNPHHVGFLHDGLRGSMARLVQQFMTAYGSPNIISTGEENPYSYPFLLMQGKSARPAYDFLNTKLVLCFGKDILGTEGPPAWMASIFGEIRQQHRNIRTHFIQASSRFSMSAAKADQWIPIIPGTAGALALGIAYILIVEGLYDHQYVQKFTAGFEDWVDESGRTHIGFKNLALKEYYPERVAGITGVAVDVIIQVARRFAQDQPAIATFGEEVTGHSNRLHSQMAIHSLNALAGSLNRKGGIFTQPFAYPSSFPQMKLDRIARQGLDQPKLDGQQPEQQSLRMIQSISQFLNNIESQQPYPLELAFVYQTNPVFELPDSKRVKQLFKKIPFLVSFSSYLDETAELADLILPDHTFLEKWDLDFGIPNIPYLYAALNQPVVEPILNSRHTGDVLLQLADKMAPVAVALPLKQYQSVILTEVKAFYDSGLGFIPGSDFEQFMYEYMLDRGFKYYRASNFEQFWRDFVTHGSWLEIPAELEHSTFHTPSQKFEFASQFLRKVSGASGESVTGQKKDRIDLELLPHYEQAQFSGAEEQFPLFLIPFHIDTLFQGEGANRPILLEMAGYNHLVRWNSWAEINPRTAHRFGIKDGESIRVESEKGNIRVKVKLFEGAVPGTISLPLGLGHTGYGRYAKGRGVNPNEILSAQTDRFSGQFTLQATRVRLSKKTG